jgi:hypothetical protein
VAEAASKAQVCQNARRNLASARRGLDELENGLPEERMMGIYNIAVLGRAVTQALQHLRTIDRDGIDTWYVPYQKAISEDGLFKYFNKLRNEVLKELAPPTSSSVHIGYFDSADLARLQAEAPPGARGFFIGDAVGGSDWEVELPDGSVEKYYVRLPAEIAVRVDLRLPDPPRTHMGVPIGETSVNHLSRMYLDYLSTMVDSAESHFGSS